MTGSLLTCEPVLAEAAFHLRRVPLVLGMIETRLITLAFDGNDHLPQLTALAKRYADRSPDLADLGLIRRSELFPKHSVITVDREGRDAPVRASRAFFTREGRVGCRREKSAKLVLTGRARLLVCAPAFWERERKNPCSVRCLRHWFGTGVFALLPSRHGVKPESVLCICLSSSVGRARPW